MADVRLIDANALRVVPDYSGTVAKGNGKTICEILFAVQQFIDNAPTIDAAPVVHGEWLDCENYNDIRQCSECGLIRNIYKQEGWNYCPNCGAKMGDQTDAD